MSLLYGLSLRNNLVTDSDIENMVSLSGYFASPGVKPVIAVQSAIEYGTSTDLGTLTGSIQCSATTVDSDFVTAVSFTVTADTDIATVEQKEFLIPANTKYLRHKAVTSTATIKQAVNCAVFLVKRSS